MALFPCRTKTFQRPEAPAWGYPSGGPLCIDHHGSLGAASQASSLKHMRACSHPLDTRQTKCQDDRDAYKPSSEPPAPSRGIGWDPAASTCHPVAHVAAKAESQFERRKAKYGLEPVLDWRLATPTAVEGDALCTALSKHTSSMWHHVIISRAEPSVTIESSGQGTRIAYH